MADTLDLGSSAVRCGGSSPLIRTIYFNHKIVTFKTILSSFQKSQKSFFTTTVQVRQHPLYKKHQQGRQGPYCLSISSLGYVKVDSLKTTILSSCPTA